MSLVSRLATNRLSRCGSSFDGRRSKTLRTRAEHVVREGVPRREEDCKYFKIGCIKSHNTPTQDFPAVVDIAGNMFMKTILVRPQPTWTPGQPVRALRRPTDATHPSRSRVGSVHRAGTTTVITRDHDRGARQSLQDTRRSLQRMPADCSRRCGRQKLQSAAETRCSPPAL